MLEFLGWIGVLLLLSAYALMTAGKLRSTDITYHLLNAVGGTAVMLSAIVKKAWPAASLEVAWVVIAFIGIYLILKKKND